MPNGRKRVSFTCRVATDLCRRRESTPVDTLLSCAQSVILTPYTSAAGLLEGPTADSCEKGGPMLNCLLPPSEKKFRTTSASEPHQIVREYIQASEQVLIQNGLSDQDKLLLLDMTGRMTQMLLGWKDESQP